MSPTAPATRTVRVGIERLLDEDRSLLADARVALVSNPASIDSRIRHSTEILGDDPAKTYDRVMADFRDAMRSPGAMDRVLSVPFGEIPAPALVGFVAFDLVVHASDLATATGQEFDPPAELVAGADAFARQAVAPEWRDGDTFAAEVDPPADATPLQRLIAFSGRQP